MTQEQINRKRERDREAKRMKRAAAREAANKPVEEPKEPIAEAPKEQTPVPGAERALETSQKADPGFHTPLDCFEVHRRRLERERRA